jgi:hypothetical protein
MTQAQLRDGHAALMRRVYEARPYFERILRGLVESPAFRQRRATQDKAIGLGSLRSRVRGSIAGTIVTYRLIRELIRRSMVARLLPEYISAYAKQRRSLGRDALPFYTFAYLCLQHWHFYNIARHEKQNTVGVARLERPGASS